MEFRLIPSGFPPTLGRHRASSGVEEGVMFGSGWCGSMGAGGWLLMALLWGSFLAVVVWAVTRLFPRARSRPGGPDGGESEGGLLGRRLAAGEIDEDTYRRLRGKLTSTR
jgi:uncharacterized membrane protein